MIRSHGFDCERTGRNGRTSEDVTHSIPGIHIEAKRDERLSVDAMVRQAERDAADGLVPVVIFRRNRQPWRVVVDANEYLKLKRIEQDTREIAGGFVNVSDMNIARAALRKAA